MRVHAFGLCSVALLALTAGAVAQTPTAASAVTAATPPAAVPADMALVALSNDYFDNYYFPNNPTTATSDGIHRFDAQLEDYSRAAVERQIKALHAYRQRIAAIDPQSLSERMRGDRELLLSNIDGTLLELETIRPWQKNPDTYSSGITGSAYTLMEREFAPAAERLRLLIARERAMPAALAAARSNLENPPQIFTQIAIEQLPGDIGFFKRDLPSAFTAVTDAALLQQFKAVNGQVVAALEDYQHWLKVELLPRSHGDFRLGTATFRAKLQDDEMVDTPLDTLLTIGMQDLRHNQTEFARVAKLLEPDKTPRQVLAELAVDYPAPDKLLDSFHATFDGLVQFIQTHHIVTIPTAGQPTLRETPPFMRATTFASMDTPGPYEEAAKEAYFNVTLPDPAWDAKRTAGFMAQFNYPVISNVAVHEAYPGHYIQFLWMHRVDDRVRKLLGANSNAEGWAHYCEQMMLDEGYGQPGNGAHDQRATLRLRLGQLQDALLRDARYVVAIRMHTQQMTLAQAREFFVREGYQSAEVGEVETKRGTGDPTYLYYTLGKLQILKMRADFMAREGSAFNLEAFHDAFMQQGFPPIKIVRRALLHDDSPTL